ncbi:MAG: ACT domain-containing protein [Firmicutes bacterium]|nr:ACT domain-containing protein [Bacillota bacterium]
MESKFLVIDKEILPEVFEKVIIVKDMLKRNEVKGITEAVRKVGISRSTYYKYKDHVFRLAQGAKAKRVTIRFLLKHEMGVLSNILEEMAKDKGNILTINQDSPINNIANVSITFDISNMDKSLNDIIKNFENMKGVEEVELIAME